jgi:hypothetical protein
MEHVFAKLQDWIQGKPGAEDYPEVISIHIPKTAGLAFRQILYNNYGQSQVLAKNQKALRLEGKTIHDHYRKRHKVIHGHLPYPLVQALHGPQTRVVAWLRSPVSRVVSNYYYNIHHEFPKRQQEDPSRKMPTLQEFIERPMRQNVMARFLEGIELEDLYFLGFQESFTSGLEQLAGKMEWRIDEADRKRRVNDNSKARSRYPQPETAIIERIEELNKQDIDLYNRALELKAQGII